MEKGIGRLLFSVVLQFGGAVAVGYATSWIVGVCIIAVLWGHNIEKH